MFWKQSDEVVAKIHFQRIAFERLQALAARAGITPELYINRAIALMGGIIELTGDDGVTTFPNGTTVKFDYDLKPVLRLVK